MLTTSIPPKDQWPVGHLEGEVLEGGWEVVAHLPRHVSATGGRFSESYIVRRGVQEAFLKALDLSGALQAPDAIRALSNLTTAYEFERDLVRSCTHMDRIVQGIDDGEVHFDQVQIPVPYIIFEKAEEGDVRNFVRTSQSLDLAWSIRSLHQIAVGLSQLHGGGIAHQDLKPSNIMVFGAQGTEGSKIGDVGRASRSGISGPIDRETVPGDATYAPPELLYREVANDWAKRQAGDLYHLGSMVSYFFLGESMTALITSQMLPVHHWKVFGGPYRDILPFVRQAFDNVLQDLDLQVPHGLNPLSQASEITQLTSYLCEPDPDLRGHPKNRAEPGNPYSVNRFVSRFDLLAQQAELDMKRGR